MASDWNESGSAARSSHLWLYILLPIVAMTLLLLALTAIYYQRIRLNPNSNRNIEQGPVHLSLSSREANTSCVNGLKEVKLFGLDFRGLHKQERECSMDLETRDVGKEGLKRDVSPHVALEKVHLPAEGPRKLSSTIEKSPMALSTQAAHARFMTNRAESLPNLRSIPDICITIPAAVHGQTRPALPQGRTWSKLFDYDVGIINEALGDPRTRNTVLSRHPPNSMRTLPCPAHCRLAGPCRPKIDFQARNGRNSTYVPLGALTPISETTESPHSSVSSVSVATIDALEDSIGATDLGISIDESHTNLERPRDSALIRISRSSPSTLDTSLRAIGSCLSRSVLDNSRPLPSVSQLGSVAILPMDTSVDGDSWSKPLISELDSCDSVSTLSNVSEVERVDNAGRGCLSTIADQSAELPIILLTPASYSSFTSISNCQDPEQFHTTDIRLDHTYSSSISSFATSIIPTVYSNASVTRPESGPTRSADGKDFDLCCPTSDESGVAVRRTNQIPVAGSVDQFSEVELWVDEDTELYYCPSPQESSMT